MGGPLPGKWMGLSDLWRCARTGAAIYGRALRRLPQDCSERVVPQPSPRWLVPPQDLGSSKVKSAAVDKGMGKV
jgi:hypothetical protein